MSNLRELLPPGGKRGIWGKGGAGGSPPPVYDFTPTVVGTIGNITVAYDKPWFGASGPGLTLAQQLLSFVSAPYADMELFFGISGPALGKGGGAVTVIVSPLSKNSDGSGGAYHYGCDFGPMPDSVLYLDATFANTTVNPIDLEVGLYVSELSECFMGHQGFWNCGFSNGEGLSRFLAEHETPPNTMNAFATGPRWAQAGFPDWISQTEQTDKDDVATGCCVVYLYWMRSLGFTIPQIVQTDATTLAGHYQTLTGKTTAYQDLLAALKDLPVTSDNPFAPPVKYFEKPILDKFLEKPPKDKDKDIYEIRGLSAFGDLALAQRVAALEATVGQLQHFIPAGMRPDLSAGSLAQEPAANKHETEPQAQPEEATGEGKD